jgi:S-methylmethionine-dependent homocysteine/selenocysteine methylase
MKEKQLSSTPTCSSTSLESLDYDDEQQQQIENNNSDNLDMIAAWTIHHIPRISGVINDLLQVMKLKRSHSLPVTTKEWNTIAFIRRS